MSPLLRRSIGMTMLSWLAMLASAGAACAQGIEIAPFGGFRAGGGFFETATGRSLDPGVAPAVGAAVDVPLSGGLQFEAAFSHQFADLFVADAPFAPPVRWRVTVEHFQAGGLQELGPRQRIRPFLTGVLGLTRYASGGDNEVRFLVGAGGGVKLFTASRVGLRLDGRVFGTLIDAEGSGLACGAGRGCLIALHVNMAWQTEFTAGLVVKLPR